MADTAKRLVGPLLIPTANTLVYTVPAATTTIVRNIHVSNNNGSPVSLNLGIGTTATLANLLYYQFPVPPSGALDWSGFLVLAATETLQVASTIAGQLVIVVSGIEVA